MEEGHKSPHEPTALQCLFHPFRIGKWTFDKINKSVEVPFRMILIRDNLTTHVSSHQELSGTETYQRVHHESLESSVVQLHTELDFALLYLPLPSSDRVFDGVSSLGMVSLHTIGNRGAKAPGPFTGRRRRLKS